MNKTFLFSLLLFNIISFSQTKREVNKIISNYDLIKLNQLQKKYSDKYKKDKAFAIEFAKKNNIPVRYNKNGTFGELQRIENGFPIYYKITNVNAAKSTRANFLHNNGGLGLNIEGQGMTAFVWDGGHALLNHQEFMVNGSSKLTPADNNSETDTDGANHATHVMGTILAKGVNSAAKGMAPQAQGYVLDWNNDVAEVISGTGIGMLLSNHSYGPDLALLNDASIGAYTSESKIWDEVMYNAPYYLKVCAAGNDGQDYFSNSSPIEGNSSFDKLYGQTTSKNTMVVANGNDASVNSQGNIFSGGNINPSSSQGPTDDYRIKPDITGNGTDLKSPIHSSVISYDIYTGTSMASPNVMGSLLLLQQLYNQEEGSFMLGSTLKGLALHTADDKGVLGPDAVYGWGYMNTKKAAETILNQNEIISENLLNNNETYTFQVTATGTEQLIASISWTDKESSNLSDGTNDTTPVLVNDLDIRITKDGDTFYPWKLISVNSNTRGDNIVDPYEKITIDNANNNDIYTISISHKGTLNNSLQNYSLVVTGISSSTASINNEITSDFNIYPNPSNKGIINITMNESRNTITKFILTGVSGKILDIKELNYDKNIYQLDYSNLKAGMYFITMLNGNSKTIKKLIIK